MRRRLQKFLPIVLIALAVQILAPIGACWAAAIAAADPLQAAQICHSSPDFGQSGQGNGHAIHDGGCAICCALHAHAALVTPQVAIPAKPYRDVEHVFWRDEALDFWTARTGSNSQARAPPAI